MKKVFVVILGLLLLLPKVNAACVEGLNVHGSVRRTNGHQSQWFDMGGYTTSGTGSVSSSCFSINNNSSIVKVTFNGSNFSFSPQGHGNASVTISVQASCTCSKEVISKTVNFKLSEWGLMNLYIKGYEISPKFEKQNIYDYTATVPNEVTSIEIYAQPVDTKSKITVIVNDVTTVNEHVGTINATINQLKVGENKIKINVVTPEDDSRDFSITVTRSGSGNTSGNSSSGESSDSVDSSQPGSSSNNSETDSSTHLGSSSNDYNPETGLNYMYFIFGLGIALLFYMIWYTKKMNLNN